MDLRRALCVPASGGTSGRVTRGRARSASSSKATAWGVALALLGFLSPAPAGAVSYGSFSGASVNFNDVEDVNGLFGAPTVSLDSIDFDPVGFEATCSDCGPAGAGVDDTLSMSVVANPGQVFDEITINEAGSYSLLAFGAEAVASASVTGFLTLDIFAVDGAAVNNVSFVGEVEYTPDSPYDSTVLGNGSGLWSGTLFVDIVQVLADAGVSGSATRVDVSFSNELEAFHAGLGSSTITKRDADLITLTIMANVIPEPATAGLLAVGLGWVGLRTRRAGPR